MPQFLKEKRAELIWALSKQGYNYEQLALIFGFKSRSSVYEIVKKMPKGWESPWHKDK